MRDSSSFELRLAVLISLLAILGMGFYLRITPIFNNHVVDLQWDSSFNQRMCEELISNGALPKVDKLSLYPQGKRIGNYLPLFLYYGVAAFHYVSKIVFGVQDVKMNIFRFNALCGALIALPVFLSVMSLVKSRAWALYAAFLSIALPLGIRRTFANYFRFEVLGILLIMMSFAFFIRALNARDTKRSILEAGLSSLFLFVAIGTWRMTLLYLSMFTVGVLCLIIYHEDLKRLFLCFFTVLLGYVIACLSIPYLQGHHFLLTRESVFLMSCAIFIGLVPIIDYLRKTPMTRAMKGKLVLLGLAVGLLGFFFMRQTDGSSLGSSVGSLMKLGFAHAFGRFDILNVQDNLFRHAAELKPVSPLELPTGSYYSASFILLMAYCYMVYRKGRSGLVCGTNLLLLFMFCFSMIGMIFFVSRMMTLVTPFSAIAIGVGMYYLHEEFKKKYPLDETKRYASRWILLAAALGIISLVTVLDASYRMTLLHYRSVRIAPNLRKVLGLFEANTPKDAVIWAHWQYGYPIQAVSGRATVMDGLFEIPEVRQRVIEEAHTLWSRNEDDIFRFAKKYGASYILISWSQLPFGAELAGLDFRDYYQAGGVTEEGKKINLLRMFKDPHSFKDIKLLFQEKQFSVFHVPGVLEEPVITPSELEIPEEEPPTPTADRMRSETFSPEARPY